MLTNASRSGTLALARFKFANRHHRLELYYDRPREYWVDANGRPMVKAEQFDWHDLLMGVA